MAEWVQAAFWVLVGLAALLVVVPLLLRLLFRSYYEERQRFLARMLRGAPEASPEVDGKGKRRLQ